MLRPKEKRFCARVVSLEQLVPQTHFYRQLEAKLDLQFVYPLVQDTYAPTLGRPAIDPVVFFKLQLIMFFEGIRSERQLMEAVQVNLAYRWYIGYDLGEAVPDHSSLSKIRVRYGLGVFQQFFEHIVELCLAAGLVWGKELYFDGSKMRANAAIESLVPRWFLKAKQHMEKLFEPPPEPKPLPTSSTPIPPATDLEGSTAAREALSTPFLRLVKAPNLPNPAPRATTEPVASRREWLVQKYDGQRFNAQRTASYQRTTDRQASRTDPDATPMTRFPGDRAKLGYHTHYVVDGGKARIILAALVTPASVMDNTPMLDLARWVRFRWKLKPRIAVGDTKYGTVENIVGLERDGLRAYVPTTDFSQRTKLYPADRFAYDRQRDVYTCPQGVELRLYSRREREEVLVYRANPKVCNHCPVKAQCTSSRSGRYLFRSFFQEELDRVHAYRETEGYKKALRKRMIWVEPLFGEAKQWHQRVRFRLRGLRKVNTEGLMTAAGQNLKRVLNRRERREPQIPSAGAVACVAPARDLALIGFRLVA